ncbi:MAG: ABC transporter permease [Acidimicrobiia bacterium]|nr:ABC transporter permease [Acidimicrobiia bacterium]MBT8250617.1 ABC transporter permease [Acidimicrobiia bacterium]NNC41644.1 ABC transporter permease [Acidimicrobiia bacterium]NNL28781.1 ABC transporter permease [Acidimicrobiia bacterium]NNL48924.1 ABC transporter permease [Acidimicrobiia bacterium]
MTVSRKKAIELLENEAGDITRLFEKPTGQWRLALRRFRGRRSGMTGLFIVVGLILVALFAPIIAPYEPNEILIGVEDVTRRDPPCIHLLGCPEETPQHIMGLDGNVRDVFSRIVYGSRVSLTLGFFTVTLALVVGSTIGAISGYAGGWLDNILMRIMDVILGFPSLLLAIAIVAVLGPGLRNALLAIAIVTLPGYARVMRAQVLAIKENDYVTASRALGSSTRSILLKRIIPNSLTPLVVLATLGVATAILEAAGLSFLGLGAQPPAAEWGSMLARERNQVFTSPHLVFFPGIAIMLTVLGFNLMGDGMRDALDPTLNR